MMQRCLECARVAAAEPRRPIVELTRAGHRLEGALGVVGLGLKAARYNYAAVSSSCAWSRCAFVSLRQVPEAHDGGVWDVVNISLIDALFIVVLRTLRSHVKTTD